MPPPAKPHVLPIVSKPLCFRSQEQFDLWRMAGRGLKGEFNYCTDCQPEYQDAMIEAKRCEHPGVTFVEDDDGFIEGVRPTPPPPHPPPPKKAWWQDRPDFDIGPSGSPLKPGS